MTRSLLVRGMFVGLLAGLLAFAFARWTGEPEVERAIAFETSMDKAAGRSPEPEMVSRKVQKSFGLLTGVAVMCSGYPSCISGDAIHAPPCEDLMTGLCRPVSLDLPRDSVSVLDEVRPSRRLFVEVGSSDIADAIDVTNVDEEYLKSLIDGGAYITEVSNEEKGHRLLN